jgi:hypothetical protein
LGFGTEFGTAAKEGIFQLVSLGFEGSNLLAVLFEWDVFWFVEDECGKLGAGGGEPVECGLVFRVEVLAQGLQVIGDSIDDETFAL